MSNSKHTPGPWTASGPRIFSYQRDAGGLDKGVLAECYTQYSVAEAVISDKEVEANARLMAAAPELLDVASRLAEWGRGGMTISELGGVIHDAARIERAMKEEV